MSFICKINQWTEKRKTLIQKILNRNRDAYHKISFRKKISVCRLHCLKKRVESGEENRNWNKRREIGAFWPWKREQRLFYFLVEKEASRAEVFKKDLKCSKVFQKLLGYWAIGLLDYWTIGWCVSKASLYGGC